jgi:hypothetical protein
MQNFDGASKLVRNTQNRPAVHKNRRKTLKTEQKQWLEACRSLTRVSPELAGEDRTGRPLQKQQQQTQMMNTDQRFNNPNINLGIGVYAAGVGPKGPVLERLPDIKNIYIFFFRWLQLRQPPQIRQNHHRTRRPASQTTKNKQNNLFFYFILFYFFHRKVFRSP